MDRQVSPNFFTRSLADSDPEVMRAINLDSFEDWTRQLARGDEPSLDLITMFVPLFRVERVFLDEPSGAIKSYGQRFEEVVGMTIQQYLHLQ